MACKILFLLYLHRKMFLPCRNPFIAVFSLHAACRILLLFFHICHTLQNPAFTVFSLYDTYTMPNHILPFIDCTLLALWGNPNNAAFEYCWFHICSRITKSSFCFFEIACWLHFALSFFCCLNTNTCFHLVVN